MKLKEISEYMKKNIENNYNIEKIAKNFGYSKFEFSRKFKKRTGFSAGRFLSFLKIEKALDMIINENESVITSQIKSGYNSSGTFSNIFTKYTGISPSNYKKTMKEFYKIMMDYLNVSENGEIFYGKYFENDKNFSLDKTDTQDSFTINLIYPERYESEITFIGLFKNCIPDELPVLGKAIIPKKTKNKCILINIPKGKYWLMACSVEKGSCFLDFFYLKNAIKAKKENPIIFPTSESNEYNLNFRKPRPSDFPVLINIPKLIREIIENKMQ